MARTFLHDTCVGDDDLEITVEFTQSKFFPAVTTGPSDGWSPAEGGEIEIVNVWAKTDKAPIDLDDDTLESVLDELGQLSPEDDEPD